LLIVAVIIIPRPASLPMCRSSSDARAVAVHPTTERRPSMPSSSSRHRHAFPAPVDGWFVGLLFRRPPNDDDGNGGCDGDDAATNDNDDATDATEDGDCARAMTPTMPTTRRRRRGCRRQPR
jgi:hypothetical protein